MQENASNTIKFTLDPNNLSPLTPEDRAELEAIVAMPDELIDYTDAPERPNAHWVMANRAFPGKKQITLQIDEDIIDFFKQHGNRYQVEMNTALRAYMQAHPLP